MKVIPARWKPTAPRPTILYLLAGCTAALGIVNYVLVEPPPAKERALAYQKLLADPDAFGWALAGVGLTVLVLASFDRTERLGGAVLVGVTSLWAGTFAWSLVTYNGGPGAWGPLIVWSTIAAIAYVNNRQVRGRGDA